MATFYRCDRCRREFDAQWRLGWVRIKTSAEFCDEDFESGKQLCTECIKLVQELLKPVPLERSRTETSRLTDDADGVMERP